MKKHKLELSFGIWGFEDILHEDLTNLIGVNPSVQHFKNHPVNPKFPNGKIAKENGWVISPPNFKEYDDFETQMNAFIELAKDKKSVLTEICKKYYCEFSCAIFLEADNGESTPWIHLGDEYNSIFGKLNVHFDVDLYV